MKMEKRLASLFLYANIILSIGLVVLAVLTPGGVSAAGPNHVGLVVDFGGNTETKCISFDGGSIGGLNVVEDAFSVATDQGAVCKVGDTGCPASNCWCKCPSPDKDCTFWSYWHLQSGNWEYANVGAGQYELRDGEVDGWAWGHLPQYGGKPPQVYSFGDICGSQVTPTDTPTPVPTDTPTPEPTATFTPTPTRTKAPTPTVTRTPTKVAGPSVHFSVEPEQVSPGACAALKWNVSNAKAVYLNGEGVSGEDSQQVCPSAGSHAYELRVVGLDDREVKRQVTLNVEGGAAPAVAVLPSSGETVPARPAEPTGEAASQPAAPAVAESPSAEAMPAPALTEVKGPTAAAQPEATVTASPTPSLTPAQVAMAQAGQGTPTAVPQQAAERAPAAQPAPVESQPAPQGTVLASKTAWFVVLAGAAVGAVGFGGLIFVGFVVALAVIYWYFSRQRSADDE